MMDLLQTYSFGKVQIVPHCSILQIDNKPFSNSFITMTNDMPKHLRKKDTLL